ncbi:MAG: amidohydrolase family protein [Blastocatellia bacterium]|nr:amidohydrolase family protein [Blastocatellia bacterium]
MTRLLLFSIFVGLLLGAATQTDRLGSPAGTLALTQVTVIDATGGPAQPEMTVVISGDRIVELGKTGRVRVPKDAVVVEAGGKFLIPGLWDMHIHLTITPEQEVSRSVILPLLVAHGVAGVRDMGGDWQRLQQLRQELAGGKLRGLQILTPGPFVDGPQPPGAFVLPVSGEAESRRAARKLKADGVDFLKVQSGLTLADYLAVAAEARIVGLPVVGHVPEAVSAFDVVRAGQRSIEHLSPALPGDAGLLLACSGKEAELRAELLALGQASAQPNADRQQLRARQRALQSQLFSTFDREKAGRLFALLAEKQIWVVPTMIWAQRFAPLSPDDLPAEPVMQAIPLTLKNRWDRRRTQVIQASTEDDFNFRRMIFERSRDLAGALHRANVPLLAGADALDGYVAPGFSLHQELELFVAAGLTPMEALQTATRNPARFLGQLASRGSVEKGKRADLVLLDADPLRDIRNTRRIHAVILGGRLIDSAERERMLRAIEDFARKH